MDAYKEAFLESAEDWVCNAYSASIAYLALKNGDHVWLSNAVIILNPLPIDSQFDFEIDTSLFCAGQYQLISKTKKSLLKILHEAIEGRIEVHGKSFRLDRSQALRFYSEGMHRDRWFSPLHLSISCERLATTSAADSSNIDILLRNNDLPFDGLDDLVGWLGLKSPTTSHDAPSIDLRVLPPVDLMIEHSSIASDTLTIKLHAIPGFDVERVNVAVRALPGIGLGSRMQISKNIEWGRSSKGIRTGMAQIKLEDSDTVLTMLMIGESNVRRQWFVDAKKARNKRYMAFQYFDKDLKMLKVSLFESPSSESFEKGVAALLFLMGFTPGQTIETDAPDIIVTTPYGEIVLVECTTRINEFTSKLGKLVQRRNSLIETMEDNIKIHGLLVCAKPISQIVIREDEIRNHKILLVTREDLSFYLDRIRNSDNPDQVLQAALASLEPKPLGQ